MKYSNPEKTIGFRPDIFVYAFQRKWRIGSCTHDLDKVQLLDSLLLERTKMPPFNFQLMRHLTMSLGIALYKNGDSIECLK